jgi:hypothetical protein
MSNANDRRTTQTAFRLPDSMIASIDEYRARLERRTPGVRVTRSDAARLLLLRGIEEATRRARAGGEA